MYQGTGTRKLPLAEALPFSSVPLNRTVTFWNQPVYKTPYATDVLLLGFYHLSCPWQVNRKREEEIQRSWKVLLYRKKAQNKDYHGKFEINRTNTALRQWYRADLTLQAICVVHNTPFPCSQNSSSLTALLHAFISYRRAHSSIF